jgi:hypothetical protein
MMVSLKANCSGPEKSVNGQQISMTAGGVGEQNFGQVLC